MKPEQKATASAACLFAELSLGSEEVPGKSRRSPLQTLYNGEQVRRKSEREELLLIIRMDKKSPRYSAIKSSQKKIKISFVGRLTADDSQR